MLDFQAHIQDGRSLGPSCAYSHYTGSVCLLPKGIHISKRQGQIIRFREVTQGYMVACNTFSAITLPKYGEILVNYSSQPVKWQALRLKWFPQHFLFCSCMQPSLK